MKCKDELLCGSVEWQETEIPCTKICAFSRDTYVQLMDFDICLYFEKINPF
jgi:hypothetical protein